MHIIAGKLKGMSLTHPKNRSFRPTQSRVKEALLSILSPHLDGARFLDLCCGTGAIGLEAASRGASTVTMVDLDSTTAKQNLGQALSRLPDLASSVLVLKRDVLSYLKSCSTGFDLIFFDPPWADLALYEAALKAISGFAILETNGLLICEHPKKVDLPEMPGLERGKSYSYGDTQLTVFHRKQ